MKKLLLVWPIASPVYPSSFWRNAWLYEMESYLEYNWHVSFKKFFCLIYFL